MWIYYTPVPTHELKPATICNTRTLFWNSARMTDLGRDLARSPIRLDIRLPPGPPLENASIVFRVAKMYCNQLAGCCFGFNVGPRSGIPHLGRHHLMRCVTKDSNVSFILAFGRRWCCVVPLDDPIFSSSHQRGLFDICIMRIFVSWVMPRSPILPIPACTTNRGCSH